MMSKSETVEKLIHKQAGGQVFKTSRGELTYESLAYEIRRGQSYVVESKDAEGKKQERALTVTTQGKIVFNDNQEEIGVTMPVENEELVAEAAAPKTAKKDDKWMSEKDYDKVNK